MRFKGILALGFISGLLLLVSCGSHKRTVYFGDIDDNAITALAVNNVEFIIQPNDILNIEASSTLESEITELATMQDPNLFASGRSTYTTKEGYILQGYLVDEAGYVQLPTIGNVKLGGLTRKQAIDFLTLKVKEFKKEPVVKIRFLNKKVLVQGEVRTPGLVFIDNEKMSVLEALARCGDLNIQGRRKDVLVIRKTGEDKVEHARLNLTSKDVFLSPYFWLAPEDIVYVAPSKTRTFSAEWATVSYTFSALSVILTLITFFKK